MLWKIVFLKKNQAIIVYAMQDEKPNEDQCRRIWEDRINPGAKMHVSKIKECTFVDLREQQSNPWVALRAEIADWRDEAKIATTKPGAQLDRFAAGTRRVAFDEVLGLMTRLGVPLSPPEDGGAARG